MTLAEFLAKYKPSYKVDQVSSRPGNMTGMALHYYVTMGYDGRKWGGFYSCGKSAHTRQAMICGKLQKVPAPPPIQSVLECLQSDCTIGKGTYREFCLEYGYNPELAEGYVTWQACRETRDGLIDLFGRAVFNEFMGIEF